MTRPLQYPALSPMPRSAASMMISRAAPPTRQEPGHPAARLRCNPSRSTGKQGTWFLCSARCTAARLQLRQCAAAGAVCLKCRPPAKLLAELAPNRNPHVSEPTLLPHCGGSHNKIPPTASPCHRFAIAPSQQGARASVQLRFTLPACSPVGSWAAPHDVPALPFVSSMLCVSLCGLGWDTEMLLQRPCWVCNCSALALRLPNSSPPLPLAPLRALQGFVASAPPAACTMGRPAAAVFRQDRWLPTAWHAR